MSEANTEAEAQALTPEQEQQRKKLINDAWSILYQSARHKQADEVDLSVYTLPWVYSSHTWQCDVPPNRATIRLVRDGSWWWWWEVCIERPDHFKHTNSSFVEPDEALKWAEQQLIAIQNEVKEPKQKPPRLTLADFSLEKQPHLAPYWIEAQAMEPERITYRVLIELECAPCDYESMEMSFGKQFRYHEKFYTPTKLARELNIDTTQVSVKQFFDWMGLYHVTSSTSYYTESLAAEKAQQLWDKSAIVQQYNVGNVLRAQYGYSEVETGYAVMLGGCESPDYPNYRLDDRAEYMAGCALSETLIYALDVKGFQAYRGIPTKWIDDEKTLAIMHKRRAESAHIPPEARAESRQWLAAHTANRS